MALSAQRNTPKLGAENETILSHVDIPQGVNTMYLGGIVVINAGYAAPATAAAGLICVGKFEPSPAVASQTNSGSAGSITARVAQGVFRFANSSSTDLIAATDIGKVCYLVDDQTVAKTIGTSTIRSIAGIIMGVDSSGVFVHMSVQTGASLSERGTGTAWQGPGSSDTISSAGAISVNTAVTAAAVTGTTAYTLADGLFLGQRKTIVVSSGASTPNATVTPATRGGSYANVSALGALGDSVEFVWANPTSPAWYIASSQGVTIA